MKTIQALFLLASITLFACNNEKKQQTAYIMETPTKEEIQEFEKAANALSNMLEPKIAELSFIVNGINYQLHTTDIKATIIPFTHYKPVNEEEGDMQENSLIWLQGTDSKNQSTISFSINLNEKFNNGDFIAQDGEIIIEKDGKKEFYSVKSIRLTIQNFDEKVFNNELSAYSLLMKFEGELTQFGANRKEFTISNGSYSIKY
jgi:hypothetical protein